MYDPIDMITELFSLQKTDGWYMWVELVVGIAHARRMGEKGPVAARELKRVAKRHDMYFLAADSRMKYAVKPLIEADPAALAYASLEPEKRTACGLAEAAAELYNLWFEDAAAEAQAYYDRAREAALHEASSQILDC